MATKGQSVGQETDRFTVRCSKCDADLYRAFAEQKGMSVNELFLTAIEAYLEAAQNDFAPTLEQEVMFQLHTDHEQLFRAVTQNTEMIVTLMDTFHLLTQGDDIPELSDRE